MAAAYLLTTTFTYSYLPTLPVVEQYDIPTFGHLFVMLMVILIVISCCLLSSSSRAGGATISTLQVFLRRALYLPFSYLVVWYFSGDGLIVQVFLYLPFCCTCRYFFLYRYTYFHPYLACTTTLRGGWCSFAGGGGRAVPFRPFASFVIFWCHLLSFFCHLFVISWPPAWSCFSTLLPRALLPLGVTRDFCFVFAVARRCCGCGRLRLVLFYYLPTLYRHFLGARLPHLPW